MRVVWVSILALLSLLMVGAASPLRVEQERIRPGGGIPALFFVGDFYLYFKDGELVSHRLSDGRVTARFKHILFTPLVRKGQLFGLRGTTLLKLDPASGREQKLLELNRLNDGLSRTPEYADMFVGPGDLIFAQAQVDNPLQAPEICSFVTVYDIKKNAPLWLRENCSPKNNALWRGDDGFVMYRGSNGGQEYVTGSVLWSDRGSQYLPYSLLTGKKIEISTDSSQFRAMEEPEPGELGVAYEGRLFYSAKDSYRSTACRLVTEKAQRDKLLAAVQRYNGGQRTVYLWYAYRCPGDLHFVEWAKIGDSTSPPWEPYYVTVLRGQLQ